MKIYFLDGRSYTIDLNLIEITTIDGITCMMCHVLTSVLRSEYNTTCYYSFFKHDPESSSSREFTHYVPTNEDAVFACETTTNPCYLHTIISFKDKNHICKKLLSHINLSDIDAPDVNGRTPLYIACVHRNAEIIPFLLERGANQHIRCNGFLSSNEYCIATRHNQGMHDIYLLVCS